MKKTRILAFALAASMAFSAMPTYAASEPVVLAAVQEDYIISDNPYMTRLHTNIDSQAEFEIGFVVRVDGEQENRFTNDMGQSLLTNGRITIDDGKEWTFQDAGLEFATADSKSSFKTTNKEFIKEFYEKDTFTVHVTTAEGYKVSLEKVENKMDASEREAFKNSLTPDVGPEEGDSGLTIEKNYTFIKNQYGTKVFRIDIHEFNGASDPAKAAFLETATISINGTDFGKMKDLGFFMTGFYGFELNDLTKIKSVIEADELNVVLTNEGKTTSFTVKNELTEAERQEIAGKEPEGPTDPETEQVDKAVLIEKIDKLNALLTDGKKYPQEAVEAAKAAIKAAEIVKNNDEATQEDVEGAILDLDVAIADMKEDVVTPGENSKYTVDPKYTFIKDQYGSQVLRIDIKEFNGGTDPKKKAFLETATISINGTDFGKMKDLGFTITNYYGFELADLTKIKSVILDDDLKIVLTDNGETTNFTLKNELTPEQRQAIAGNKPEVVEKNTFAATTAILVKSDDTGEPSMSGATMKPEAQMLKDADGNTTVILHFAPAEIMGILAYATGLELQGATTEFIMKEDNSAVCIVKMPEFKESDKIIQGHIYSSVMDADVALKVTQPTESMAMSEALTQKITEVETLLETENFYENTKKPVLEAVAAAKNAEDKITAYVNILKAEAGLRKIAADPFTDDTLFHVNAIDTSIIGSKSLAPYIKVEIIDGKKVLTAHYNSYLDWDGLIYITSIKVLNQDGEEIPSTYTLDEDKNGTLTFEMPYVPSSGIFDLKMVNGNEPDRTFESQIKMDYSTIVKGPFKKLLEDAIEQYGKYTDEDWSTRLDMETRKDSYTEASWDVFAKALQQCKDDLNKPVITQEEIETAAKNLKDARRNLVYKVSAGHGNTANAGISGINNPSAPYYPSDPHAEHPEYVGWAGSKIVYGNNGDVYYVLNNGQEENGESTVNTGKMLLMSESLRVKQPYTTSDGSSSTRWNDSILRQYMNDNVYNTMFSDIEKAAILKTQVSTFDYNDGYFGLPTQAAGTEKITEDFIFAPGFKMVTSEAYGFGSNDSRIVPTEYALREVMKDVLEEEVLIGVSPKGRIGGTFTVASQNIESPVCMNIDANKILMTVDAKAGIPEGLQPSKALDSNLWKLVMLDDSKKLENEYTAVVDNNKVSVDLGNYDGQVMAAVVTGDDFKTGQIKYYGIVDAAGFTVPEFNNATDKLYVMAVSDEAGKTAYASEPALVKVGQDIEPQNPVDPEANKTQITIAMNKDNETVPSMCDPMFAEKADVEIKGDKAIVKIYVANPVPNFAEEGKDGTLKDFVIQYNGKDYKAVSDITTKPMMKVKADNPLFGLVKGTEVSAQVLTVELPKEALNEAYLNVNCYVNVVMNSTVDFDMALSDVVLPEPGVPTLAEGKYTSVVTMMHEAKEQPSMCDPMFDAKADIEIKGEEATLKLLVANPVPGFPEQGADGTVKDVVINYNGKTYPVESKLNTGVKMTAKADNTLFGLKAGEQYDAQVLTVTLPKEAIQEGALLKTDAFVNVVMNTDVIFRISLTDIKKAEMPEPEPTDPVKEFVARLYTEVLGREADEKGLNDWTEVLKAQKETGAKVAMGFVDSDEFKAKDMTDEAFLQIMYRTFLGRDADEAGLAGWSKVLDEGMSRMFVFRGFVESDEFTKICEEYDIVRGNVDLKAPMDQVANQDTTKFVARLYKVFLGRKADAEGINGWVSQLASGKNNAKQAAFGFVMSDEFQGKNLSNENYVKTIYIGLLDREADPAGLASWVKVLEDGGSRLDIFYGFADSPEFRDLARSYKLNGDWSAN